MGLTLTRTKQMQNLLKMLRKEYGTAIDFLTLIISITLYHPVVYLRINSIFYLWKVVNIMSSKTNKIIDSILNSYDFEKVSDLTKEQFSEILSEIFNESTTDSTLDKKTSKSRHHSHRHRH